VVGAPVPVDWGGAVVVDVGGVKSFASRPPHPTRVNANSVGRAERDDVKFMLSLPFEDDRRRCPSFHSSNPLRMSCVGVIC
jgi:hypothetical protein